MNKTIAKSILRLMGWRIEGTPPTLEKKYLVIMAPHTSNWDFWLGWLGYGYLGLKSKYLVKKEAFIAPFGNMMKRNGGIPVDRGRSNKVVLQVGDLFKHSEELIITVTPEGTRGLNMTWKKGFYYIALYAKVPIVLGFLDYKTKTGGLGPLVHITGDYEKDMKFIEQFYKGKTARYPENFNLSPENLDKHLRK